MKNTDLARQLLIDTRFNPQAPPPEDKTVFRMKFKRVGSLGDFILFTGKKSSGKSHYVAGAIAAAISAKEVFNFNIKLPPGKTRVLHIDTEQGHVSHYKMMKLICQLADLETLPAKLQSNRCRSVAPHLILLMIEEYLKQNPDCGMIFLDGMLDVVENMNDERDAARLKRWMQSISDQHNILFAGVIHRGFSADKAIGHLGSYLERGAQTVFSIKRVDENGAVYFTIDTEYIRDDAPPEGTAIYYNAQAGAWQLFDYVRPEEKEEKTGKNSPYTLDISEHARRVGQIFAVLPELSYKELAQNVQEAYGVGSNYARSTFIPFLLREQLIFKIEGGYTCNRQARLYPLTANSKQ